MKLLKEDRGIQGFHGQQDEKDITELSKPEVLRSHQ